MKELRIWSMTMAPYDKISQECDALKQAILRQVFE